MVSKKRKNKQKEIAKTISIILILIILLLGINYIAYQTNFLKPHIDTKTIEYISFYNKEITNSILIKNIRKMSNKKGKTNRNKSSLNLNITGKSGEKYEVVLYSQTANIDENFINTFLEHKNEKKTRILQNLQDSNDGGKIIYQGEVDNSNIILRLWVSKKYSSKVKGNSFEVRIKSGWEK